MRILCGFRADQDKNYRMERESRSKSWVYGSWVFSYILIHNAGLALVRGFNQMEIL